MFFEQGLIAYADIANIIAGSKAATLLMTSYIEQNFSGCDQSTQQAPDFYQSDYFHLAALVCQAVEVKRTAFPDQAQDAQSLWLSGFARVYGICCEVNKDDAKRYLEQAVALGNPHALNTLANVYLWETPENYTEWHLLSNLAKTLLAETNIQTVPRSAKTDPNWCDTVIFTYTDTLTTEFPFSSNTDLNTEKSYFRSLTKALTLLKSLQVTDATLADKVNILKSNIANYLNFALTKLFDQLKQNKFQATSDNEFEKENLYLEFLNNNTNLIDGADILRQYEARYTQIIQEYADHITNGRNGYIEVIPVLQRLATANRASANEALKTVYESAITRIHRHVNGEYGLYPNELTELTVIAESGYEPAVNTLQTYYMKKGEEWFKISSIENLKEGAKTRPELLYWLGRYYENKSTSKNHVHAFNCYQQAGAKGCTEAISRQGRCYLHGIGVTKDIKIALWSFYSAARKKSYSGLEELIQLCGDISQPRTSVIASIYLGMNSAEHTQNQSSNMSGANFYGNSYWSIAYGINRELFIEHALSLLTNEQCPLNFKVCLLQCAIAQESESDKQEERFATFTEADLTIALSNPSDFLRLITDIETLLSAMRNFPEKKDQIMSFIFSTECALDHYFSCCKDLWNFTATFPEHILLLNEKILNAPGKLSRLMLKANLSEFQRIAEFFPEHKSTLCEHVLTVDGELDRLLTSPNEIRRFTNCFPGTASRLFDMPGMLSRMIQSPDDLFYWAQPAHITYLCEHVVQVPSMLHPLLDIADAHYLVLMKDTFPEQTSLIADYVFSHPDKLYQLNDNSNTFYYLARGFPNKKKELLHWLLTDLDAFVRIIDTDEKFEEFHNYVSNLRFFNDNSLLFVLTQNNLLRFTDDLRARLRNQSIAQMTKIAWLLSYSRVNTMSRSNQALTSFGLADLIVRHRNESVISLEDAYLVAHHALKRANPPREKTELYFQKLRIRLQENMVDPVNDVDPRERVLRGLIMNDPAIDETDRDMDLIHHIKAGLHNGDVEIQRLTRRAVCAWILAYKGNSFVTRVTLEYPRNKANWSNNECYLSMEHPYELYVFQDDWFRWHADPVFGEYLKALGGTSLRLANLQIFPEPAWIRDSNTPALAQMIKASNIKSLDLTNICGPSLDNRQVCIRLVALINSGVNEIDLSRNHLFELSEFNIARLMTSLIQSNITSLGFQHNTSLTVISPVSWECFCDKIPQLPLKFLDLSHNQLKDEEIILLAARLKDNLALVSLDLSGNDFGVKGVMALVETIACNTTLMSISLGEGNEHQPVIDRAFAKRNTQDDSSKIAEANAGFPVSRVGLFSSTNEVSLPENLIEATTNRP